MDALTEKRYHLIDRAIHNNSISSIFINNENYEILTAKNGMRYLTWEGKTFIQQDPKRSTFWSKKAKNNQITRIMRSGGRGTSWGLIVNGAIELE